MKNILYILINYITDKIIENICIKFINFYLKYYNILSSIPYKVYLYNLYEYLFLIKYYIYFIIISIYIIILYPFHMIYTLIYIYILSLDSNNLIFNNTYINKIILLGIQVFTWYYIFFYLILVILLNMSLIDFYKLCIYIKYIYLYIIIIISFFLKKIFLYLNIYITILIYSKPILYKLYYIIIRLPYEDYRMEIWKGIFYAWDIYAYIKNYLILMWWSSYIGDSVHTYYSCTCCVLQRFFLYDLYTYLFLISSKLHYYIYNVYVYLYKVHYFFLLDCHIVLWYYTIKISLYFSMMWLYNYTVFLFLYYFPANWDYPYRIFLYYIKGKNFTDLYVFCDLLYKILRITWKYIVSYIVYPIINYLFFFLYFYIYMYLIYTKIYLVETFFYIEFYMYNFLINNLLFCTYIYMYILNLYKIIFNFFLIKNFLNFIIIIFFYILSFFFFIKNIYIYIYLYIYIWVVYNIYMYIYIYYICLYTYIYIYIINLFIFNSIYSIYIYIFFYCIIFIYKVLYIYTLCISLFFFLLYIINVLLNIIFISFFFLIKILYIYIVMYSILFCIFLIYFKININYYIEVINDVIDIYYSIYILNYIIYLYNFKLLLKKNIIIEILNFIKKNKKLLINLIGNFNYKILLQYFQYKKIFYNEKIIFLIKNVDYIIIYLLKIYDVKTQRDMIKNFFKILILLIYLLNFFFSYPVHVDKELKGFFEKGLKKQINNMKDLQTLNFIRNFNLIEVIVDEVFDKEYILKVFLLEFKNEQHSNDDNDDDDDDNSDDNDDNSDDDDNNSDNIDYKNNKCIIKNEKNYQNLIYKLDWYFNCFIVLYYFFFKNLYILIKKYKLDKYFKINFYINFELQDCLEFKKIPFKLQNSNFSEIILSDKINIIFEFLKKEQNKRNLINMILNKRYIEYIYICTLFNEFYLNINLFFLELKKIFYTYDYIYNINYMYDIYLYVYKLFYLIYCKDIKFLNLYVNKITNLINSSKYLYINFFDKKEYNKIYNIINYNKENLFINNNNLNIKFFKENLLIKFLFKDFFFNKKLLSIIYNNKFFDYYSILLFKKYYNFDLFNNNIINILFSEFSENIEFNYKTNMFIEKDLIKNKFLLLDELIYHDISFLEISNIKNFNDTNLISTINTESFFFISNYTYNNNCYYNYTIELLLGDYFRDLLNIYTVNYGNYINKFFKNSIIKNPYYYINELFWYQTETFNIWDYMNEDYINLNIYTLYNYNLGLFDDQEEIFKYINNSVFGNDADLSRNFLFKTLNFEIYDQIIFFDEYNYNFINVFLIPFLYEIVLIYSFNNFKLFIKELKINNEIYNYLYTNLIFETQNYWNMYIYFVSENLSNKVLANTYYYKKFNKFNKYFIKDFKNRLTFTNKEIDLINYYNTYVNDEIIYEPYKYHVNLLPFFKKKKTKKYVILTSDNLFDYIDGYQMIDNFSFFYNLEFYIEYNTFVRTIYQTDQDIILYSQFELSTKIQNNESILNNRFFKYLNSNLLHDSVYQIINSIEKFKLDFTKRGKKDKSSKYNYSYKEYDFNEYTGFFVDNLKIFIDENDIIHVPIHDNTIYNNLTFETPFEAKSKSINNFFEFTGVKQFKDLKNLELYLYNFFFDYYIYSMKVLLLDLILINEYNYYLNNQYIIGPIKEFIVKKKDFYFFEKIFFFFNRITKFILDLNFFENYYIEFGSYKFYYGYFFQFPFFLIVYFLQHLYIFFYLIYNEKYYYNNKKHYRRRFLKYVQIPPLVYDIIFEFFNFPDVPFKNAFMYNISDYEGYYDNDFILTSIVYESLGFNGYLVDLDNRYFLNTGVPSVIFNYQTSGFYIFYYYLILIKDILILVLMRLIIVILNNIYIYVYYLYKLFNNVLIINEIILFFFFSSINIILLFIINICIYIYKYIINILYNINFLYYLNIFFKYLLIINKFLIFPFELNRVLINYIINNCYKFLLKKYFLKYFFNKNIIKYSLYSIYILLLLLLKLLVIYICIILLFNYYDLILIFLEKKLFIKFSFRSIFVLYAIFLFLNIILLLYPLKSAKSLWNFRYYYLAILFVLWFLSSNINNIEYLLMQYWDTITMNANLVLYGPMFYEHFLSYANYEILWTNIHTFSSSLDFWWHPTIIYYIDLPIDLYIKSKNIYFDFIKSWNYYYLLLMEWSTAKAIDNYLHKNVINSIKSINNIILFNILDIFSFIKNTLKIKSINTSNNFIFFYKNYYSLFCINFLSLDKAYLYKILYGIGGIYFGGVNCYYPNMNNFNYKSMMRITYYRHIFNKLRLDLWGNYVYNPYNFFSFYKRNWFISEKEFHYKTLQTYTQSDSPYHKYEKANETHWVATIYPGHAAYMNVPFPFMEKKGKNSAYTTFFHTNQFDTSIYAFESFTNDAYEVRLLHQNYPHATIQERINEDEDTQGDFYNFQNSSHIFFSKYLVPDLGYIGSSYWGVNFGYLQITDIVTFDSFFFNKNKKQVRISK